MAERESLPFAERADRFVRAAVDETPGPVDGPFQLARRLLAREPALARASVHTALVLGDVEAVRGEVERDPEWVRRPGGPAARQPLLYATYSKLHRESPEIAAGLLATARLLLDRGADPDASFATGPWELRSLCGACGIADFPAMAELLLDRGATIDDGESLYHSLEHPDTRCLELLLARGVNPQGTNALHHAFDRPGLERIRMLLAHGADPNEALGEEGTALHTAIQRGRERAVLELLVAHGADVEARRGDGRSPYQVALQHGDSEAAAYLAGLGVDTAATPFERFAEACGRGDLEAARSVAAGEPRLFATLSEQDRRAFLDLAQAGRTAMIAAMIDCGFPVGTTGPRRQTALHWASWRGWRETVAALLARGAAVDAVENEYGATPLRWAEHGSENLRNPDGDYEEVMRLLREAGGKS
jgi:ankyrin repeat protein